MIWDSIRSKTGESSDAHKLVKSTKGSHNVDVPVVSPGGPIDLRIVISDYSAYMSSRAKLTALLHDLYPECRFETNLILDAFECGIADRIASMKFVNAVQMTSFIKQLEQDYGLQTQNAVQAIKKWAEAYGCKVQMPDTSAFVPKLSKIAVATTTSIEIAQQQQSINNLGVPVIQHNPNAYAPAGSTNGDSSDYQTSDVSGGVEITKFRGFDEGDVVVPSSIDGKRVVGVAAGAYRDCLSMKTLIISEGICYIEDGAFANCKNLKILQLPQTLIRIGSENQKKQYLTYDPITGAFEGCSIVELYLPQGLVLVGRAAFRDCKHLQMISFPLSLKFIGANSFENCVLLKHIDLPNEVKIIADGAFMKCGLVDVILPDRIQEIGARAFFACKQLKKLRLPSSVRSLGASAFNTCLALTDVSLNEGLTSIGDQCFARCAFTQITIPMTVEMIGKEVFTVNRSARYDNSDGLGSYSWDHVINPNLSIYCYAGSKGLEWARDNGYPVKNASKKQ